MCNKKAASNHPGMNHKIISGLKRSKRHVLVHSFPFVYQFFHVSFLLLFLLFVFVSSRKQIKTPSVSGPVTLGPEGVRLRKV